MKPSSSITSTRPTRRAVVRGLAALGTAGTLAGCLGGSSASASAAEAGSDSTLAAGSGTTRPPTVGPSTSTGGEAAAFDCRDVPSALDPFDAAAVGFTFGFDAPDGATYVLEAGETAVERVATFYFERDGAASRMDWDFYVEVAESVDTYADLGTTYPDATEVFSLDYAGTAVPVRHQAVTDDQDIWVMGLPVSDEFRFARVSSSVVPGQFGCHDVIRDVASRVTRSIRPR